MPKSFRIIPLLVFSLTAFINITAQFRTQSGRFAFALNSSQQVFALTPDNKFAVVLKNDPVATHPAFLTSFDPLTGTEFDNETFGFGPLEVKIAQTSAGLRVVVLTSEGGPRKIFLFDLSPTGQLTQLASTQLTNSGTDFNTNMVLSGNADVGFIVVSTGELLTFSLIDAAILNRHPSTFGETLALTEANGKRVLALHGGRGVRLLNLINPTQPALLGDLLLPATGEFSGFRGAPPVFSGDGKFLFVTSPFAEFGVIDVEAVQIKTTIGGASRFNRVALFEDSQRRLLALQSSQSNAGGLSGIHLVDATDPAQLVTINQLSAPDAAGFKSSAKFSKDASLLFVQTATEIAAYNLPSFTTHWKKTAPAAFREHQLEVYGDDEVLAAWEASAALGFNALFAAFPRNLPDVSVNDVTVNEGDSSSVNADFNVTLSAPSNHKVTVTYFTSDDTASAATDYVGTSSASVVFQPGETSKTVSIEILGDTLDEFSETFRLNLNNVDVGTIVRSQGTATIISNDPPPNISVGDTTVLEGDFGGGNATFVITLSQASAKPISVDFATADGTAVAGEDYVANSGTVSFAAGQTQANVNVQMIADVVLEPSETFTLNLSNPVNVAISRGQATATIQNDDQPGIRLQFSSAFVSENTSAVNVTVLRKGDLAVPASIDYQTSDAGGSSPCNVATGQASSRCDYMTALGTVQFAPGEFAKTFRIPIVNDVFVEGLEIFTITLSNPTGGPLIAPSSATVTIFDNDSFAAPNPIDTANFFVRLHYIDFLNREPDIAGLNFWTNQITSCGSDTTCTEIRRINVSAAFFVSIEFQETGYLVYRSYKSAFGNLPGKPVPVRFLELLRDTQQIGRGVQVGIGNWEAQLAANKEAYALLFVQRTEFLAAYPNALTAEQFVTQMNTNAGGVLSDAEKASLISLLGATPADITKRASVLRAIAENENLKDAEFNKAFVLMQYFGYLRRNPDDAPDTDFAGFNFWLNKLNQFNGNFVEAEMVKAFISSLEYRQRFGP